MADRPYTSIRVILPEETLKDMKKVREEVDEQSLLMAAMNGQQAEKIGNYLSQGDKERKSQVYYFSLPESVQTYYDLPSSSDLKSDASNILEEINGKILASPGSVEVKNGVVKKKPIEFFNYLHTSTISSMTHRAQIFLVLRDPDGKIIKTVPFNFSTFKHSKDIKSMLSGKYETGFGAAIESISVTSDAQDPALSKFVTCDVQIKLASGRYLNDYVNNTYKHPTKPTVDDKPQKLCIEDLFYTDKHEHAVETEGGRKFKCTAEIQITMGYTEPALGFQGTKQQKDELKNNLHNMTHSFFLKPTDYDYIAEPNGMVTLTVKYASSFDADMDSRTRKKISKLKKSNIETDEEILKSLTSQYQKNFPDTTEKTDKEFNKFVDYMEKAIAVTKQKTRHTRILSIIDEITRDGERTFVLPYRITGIQREDTEPGPIRDENVAEEEEDKANKKAAIRYRFYNPRFRNDFAANASPEEYSSREALRTIEFVLFGDIIDYVFQEFFTYNGSSTEEVTKYKAAIFSAFSFAMYEHVQNKDVYKLFSIRNTPVSIDLLWDILYNSKISQTEEGGFSKSTYYVDLVSKVYSSIYKSCDKMSNLLSSKPRYDRLSHTIRKLGMPEINAHEIYVPLKCFDDLERAKKKDNGFLRKPAIDSLVRNRAMVLAQGSTASADPDPSKYARVLFFTSHIPFSPTSEKIRKPDFIFKSHGQYGIVKNLSYSPVDVDGLLESAIATRTRDKDPSQVDTENDDLYYKTLLKVDIETFGMPVVIPGQVVNVDRVLLAVEEDSKIARSLTNSFFITRVTTTMDPSNYTTVIEGYPRLPENPDKKKNKKPKPNPVLTNNRDKIKAFLTTYTGYISQNPDSSGRNYEEIFSKIFDRFLNGTHALIRYFPSALPNKTQIVSLRDIVGIDTTALGAHAYDPGNWSTKPTLIAKFSDLPGNVEDAAEEKGLATNTVCYEVITHLFGDENFRYKVSADPTLIAVETALEISKQAGTQIASLALMLGYSSPGPDPTSIGSTLKACVGHLKRTTENPVSRDGEPYDRMDALLLFAEILSTCFEVWNTALINKIIPNMHAMSKTAINKLISSRGSEIPSAYGVSVESRLGHARVLEDLRNDIRLAKAEEISTNLSILLDQIIDSGS